MNNVSENLTVILPKKQLYLFGYEYYFNSFIKLYQKNTLPNVILLSGPNGSGKATFAYHFINYLLSYNEKDKYSVNDFTINPENKSYKYLCDNTHPNFSLLENDELSENIKKDNVRNTLKFLNKMTISELTTIMVGGFATIAGGVLAGYIAMGVPAGHLVAASVMSAPAALVIGKIIFPEKEISQTSGNVELPVINVGSNAIEAATNGITDGLKLAVNVGAMLIGFIALIAVLDVILNTLDWLIDGQILKGLYIEYQTSGLSPIEGEYNGYFPGSLKTFFGTILAPLAFMMGVPWDDAMQVGNLLGIKLSLNEFVAFGTLGDYIQNEMISERSIIISTYALCGFANFSSIAIQIGGIGGIAPNRRSDLARIGFRAMIGGSLAAFMTATIAGMLI